MRGISRVINVRIFFQMLFQFRKLSCISQRLISLLRRIFVIQHFADRLPPVGPTTSYLTGAERGLAPVFPLSIFYHYIHHFTLKQRINHFYNS